MDHNPPSTPVGAGRLARGPKTPQSARQRGRSGAPPSTRLSGFCTPRRGAGLSSGLLSQLASTASPHSSTAQPPTTPRSPPTGRVNTVFPQLPIGADYTLDRQIGEGTFSTVFLAVGRRPGQPPLALKHLVPTSKPSRILMETDCMRRAAGHQNVVRLVGSWRVGGDVVLAMPFIQHCRFVDLVGSVELQETRLYLANLLAALQHIHRLGIIHRDIKPSNFLYDRSLKKFSLVDFGLAQLECEVQVGGRSTKRKGEETGQGGGVVKRGRPPLEEAASKLNCSSPRGRLLRDHREGLRRSPRKLGGPLQCPAEVPKQKLNFGSPVKPAPSPAVVPVRQSPRKLSTKLTITQHTIVSPDCSAVPSSSLHRTPSFTLLEPSALGTSQATDGGTGRTPLLRASITSHCSSARPGLPRPAPASPALSLACDCPGQLAVCPTCLTWPHLHAARAGTPGFRPPEVLLKSRTQTVAVDMWAVGVILLSLFSRSYPFFRSPDDMTALAELITLFGSEKMEAAAKGYGRKLSASMQKRECDLEKLCRQLGARAENAPCLVTTEGISLLKQLLQLDFKKRITASDALKHPFVSDFDPANISS